MNNVSDRSLATRVIVIFTTTLVSFISLTTLFGLIFGDLAYSVPNAFPLVGGASGTLPTSIFSQMFIRVAVVTIAFAVLVGIFNLLLVNIQRTLNGPTITSKINSATVFVAFLVGIIAPVSNPQLGDFLLENVQTSIESALAALIFFALVYGAFRILKRKMTLSAIIFVVTIEIVLIGALPAGDSNLARLIFDYIGQFTDWLFNVPVNAGARGILLGIALATLMTGLRVLIGQDRTYGE